jgi:hypothetical protein
LTCRVSYCHQQYAPHHQQWERAWCIPVLCLWCVHAECMFLFFKILDCWTVRYWNKVSQSCTRMLRYRTEIPDALMPMPVASASMRCPAILIRYWLFCYLKTYALI